MNRVARRVERLVAGMVLIPAASLGASLATSAPAHAATCAGPTGVTVVVDHHGLGGGVAIRCAVSGGGNGADADFSATGFDLTYVQRQPGFVCRVDGAPASDPCVSTPPADAYWSLWWTDGTTGQWSYSSLGVGSLDVPDGGFVALSWQGSGGKAPPRAPASAPAASPSPTASSSPSPSQSPSLSPAPTPIPTPTPTASPPLTATPVPTAVPTAAISSPTAAGNPTPPRTAHPSALRASQAPRSHGASASPSPRASVSPKATTEPSRKAPTTSTSSGLPGWLASVLVLVVFAAAATVAVVRRRRGGS